MLLVIRFREGLVCGIAVLRQGGFFGYEGSFEGRRWFGRGEWFDSTDGQRVQVCRWHFEGTILIVGRGGRIF